MPSDEYFRKIEDSGIPVHPHEIENYMRKQLTDYRPDAPFFESDQIRDPNDRGSGFGSEERLNLRYGGARSTESPELPDGTFLDFEFTERDPRGVQNLPDFSGLNKQRMARGIFLKPQNDDNFSVPESGINPVQMVSLIRGNQGEIQDRLQIFEESMDSWHNGGINARTPNNALYVTTDGTILNIAEAGNIIKDKVSELSNRTPAIPHYTESDHRVQIARYGKIRPMMDIGSANWNTNRYNSYLDHSIPVNRDGKNISRNLALLIKDLEGTRNTKQIVAQGTKYDDSMADATRDSRYKLNPEDVKKLMAIGFKRTQPASANQQYFEGKLKQRYINRDFDLHPTMFGAKMNHVIVESMAAGNAKMANHEMSDLRDKIKKSAADNGIYNEVKPMSVVEKMTNRLNDSKHVKRSGMQDDQTKTVVNYGRIKPKLTDRFDISNEDYKTQSWDTQYRTKGRGDLGLTAERSTKQSIQENEFELPGRYEMPADTIDIRKDNSTMSDNFKDSEDGNRLRQTLEKMILAE